jgi:transglutaminase-like putative cysteine protease
VSPAHPAHPDRAPTPPWLFAGIAGATSGAMAIAAHQAASQGRFPPEVGAVGGVAVALLGLFGLPSLSVRLVARVFLGVSAVLMARFAVLIGSPLEAGQALPAWVVAAVAVFVLTDRAGTAAQPPLGPPVDVGSPHRSSVAAVAAGPSTGAAGGPAGGGRWPREAGLAVRAVVVVAAVVLAFGVVAAPVAVSHLPAAAVQAGDGPTLDAAGRSGSLRSVGSLDMTRRPAPGDDVVFTVQADRATFWRGQTFDGWDGRTWTQSVTARFALDPPGVVTNLPDDIGARGGDELVQEVRIEAPAADIAFAAASPVSIESARPVGQRLDGTLVTTGTAFGRGSTYRVVSRSPLLSEARLRAVDGGEVPADIARRYASMPVATERVVAAAKRVTRSATTDYDRIRALEAWMGGRTEYSLDAPLSPGGVDVVDHFLFTSKQGWCEQVASSLVVMARAIGIPARLVTGYVPGDYDRVTGRFVVKAKHAHAWAEVWFPEVGWVPFDPTADVPLAGVDASGRTLSAWLADHAVVLALGLAAVAAVAGPGLLLWRRWRGRIRAFLSARWPGRRRRAVAWVAAADARLADLGSRAGWPRSAHETASAFARSLGLHLGDDRLAGVGRVIDDAQYAPNPPSEAERAEVDGVLAALVDALPSRPARRGRRVGRPPQ